MPIGFNPSNVWSPTGKFSLAVVEHEGKKIHLCGQGSLDKNGNILGINDIDEQTHYTLKNIKTVIGSVGGSMDDIVSMYIYVTDIKNLEAIHKIREQFFNKPYPASTLVEVSSLVYPELLIEITAIAVIPYERFIEPTST